MNKLLILFILVGSAVFASFGHSAENDQNTYTPLEMTHITIRLTGGFPYGELYPCPENCALRLLPFTPNARIYLHGILTPIGELQDGQELVGTVFINSQPIDAIDQIVAK